MPRSVLLCTVLLVAFAAFLAGCDSLGKLFAHKPPPGNGSGTTVVVDEGGDDGPLVDGGDISSSRHGQLPTVIISPVHPEACVFPRGTAVGQGIVVRRTMEDASDEERWAVVGKQGDLLWVEHVTTSPQDASVKEVTWYLVGPDGRARLVLRGEKGKKPAGQLEIKDDEFKTEGYLELVRSAEPTGAAETIAVGGKNVEARRVDIEGGEAHVDDGPFFGLVRLVYGEDDEREIYERMAVLSDCTPSMTGGLPKYEPTKGAGK